MNTFEWNWNTSDGLKVHSKGWSPEKKIKAVICLVHGIGEHLERYAHVGAAMASSGYAFLGFDLRGHGKSEGPRGHTPSYETFMNDIATFLEEAGKRYPGLPRFLYGHSLGGNLVLNYILHRKPDLAGVIATSPWLKLAFQPPASKVALGRAMNKILPGFTQPNGLERAALSRDPEVVRKYETDPLVHDKISARLFVETFDAGLWALDHAAEFSIPLLLMHGTADRLDSVEASQDFTKSAGKMATLRLWDGLYHEIHNEPEKEQVFKVMTDWLDRQIKK